MATYRGLFMRLKDKHTNVPDKLKLAKFAWGDEAVVIPNKYEQILDYLCGVLVNKKKHKIGSEDEIAIWRTVSNFLQVSGGKISVKASIIQVVTDAILLSVKSKTYSTANADLLTSVISTALHLLKIPSITASHFENQCQLLSAICQLHTVLSPVQLQQCDATSLLKLSVEVVTRSQLRHPNQIQVYTSTNEKLLVYALKCNQKYLLPELETFLLSYLLHPDHQGSYSTFLKHNEDQTQPWSKPPPKYISTFFSVLASQKCSYIATSLLPAFIQRFVKLNQTDPRSCFLMIKFTLGTTLELDLEQACLPSYLNAEEWMTCIAGYCQVCLCCDLVSANSDQNDIIKWFCQLTELVLPQKRDAIWFDYMTSLLSFSPLVVEKYLVTILQRGLTDSQQVVAGCAKSQDVFLSDLLSLYLKLRRTQDLVNALVSALQLGVSDLEHIGKLRDFHHKLGVMFNEVPIMTLTAIWEKLIQCVSNYIPSVNDEEMGSEDSTKVSFVLMLLMMLVNHARIFGQRSMGISGHRVELLMTRMQESVLLPLSKRKSARKIHHLKEVLNAWASAKMLFFPKWRELPMEEEGTTSNTDSKALQTLITKTDLVTRVKLKLQRRNITHKGSETDLADITDASNFVIELLEFPSLTQDMIFMPCDENTEDKNLVQKMVHQFKQFTNLFPLTGRLLNSGAIDKCAGIVVEVLSYQNENGTERFHAQGTSIYHEVHKFLSHPATREVNALQSSVAAKIWCKLISLSNQELCSPKKKKKKRESDESHTSHDVQDLHLHQFITGQGEELPDLSMDLEIMSKSFSVSIEHAPALIQVLLSLDLECVRLMNLKSQLGFLILLAYIKERHQSEDLLSELCQRGLSRCFSVPNLSEFFKLTKPQAFLIFIMELCHQKMDKRQELLSCAVFGVMNDRSAVLSIPPLIKQLIAGLREEDERNLPDPTKIQTCALLIQNCGRYISKNFHIKEVASAAMDIFCTLSKFTIKHSLQWLDRPIETKKSSPEKEVTKSKKRRKSKLDSSPISDCTNKEINSELWCASLNCFSEVLHLWTDDIADERISNQLCASIETLHGKVQSALVSGSEMNEQTKIAQLRFLQACCHCHQRLSKGMEPTASDQSDISLLNVEIIDQIWSSCLTLFKSELSDFVSKSHNSIQVYEKTTGSPLSLVNWNSWPSPVTACLDVMTSVMECVTPTTFTRHLQSMMALLTPDKNTNVSAVIVVLSVWRRLLQSTLLSEASVREVFANIYEFLSSSLNLLQHMEYVKHAALEKLSQSASEEEGKKEIKTTYLISDSTLCPEVWIPHVSRFLLHSMADYIDLANIIITPRTILLCLQAGVTFEVTSTEDLEALLRLVNTFVVHHPVAAIKAAATLVSLVSKLICSCVSLGFSEHLSTKTLQIDKVVHCAQLVTRVLIVLASGDYKKELGKIAHCALADYIMEVQKGTLNVSVKKELVRGLYRLISICDKYRLASLFTSLPPGVKDTFKFMHQDYEKYYRYKGNV